MKLQDLQIDIYADGATKKDMLELAKKDYIAGMTTNPTLMAKAGIKDYKAFALEILSEIKVKPISFEVFADELKEMKRQAYEINSWGSNVFVKIPITNSIGQSTTSLMSELSNDGININATGIFTLEQVSETVKALNTDMRSIISVFAGRIADTGQNPIPLMKQALRICQEISPNSKLLWASPRELLNIIEADQMGCNIITVSPDILGKLNLLGKDLTQFSLETCQMFYNDAQKAGYTL